MKPQWPEWEQVAYDAADVLVGDPSHNRNLVSHERCYVDGMRVDLWMIRQPTSHRDLTPHVLKLTVSEARPSAIFDGMTQWHVVFHVETPHAGVSTRDHAAERLRQKAAFYARSTKP